MTENDKELKIQFAPGCFDHFEGTQEELDELVKELQDMFTNMSPEELKAQSKPLTDEELDELPPEVQEQLIRSMLEDAGINEMSELLEEIEDEDIANMIRSMNTTGRKLQ